MAPMTKIIIPKDIKSCVRMSPTYPDDLLDATELAEGEPIGYFDFVLRYSLSDSSRLKPGDGMPAAEGLILPTGDITNRKKDSVLPWPIANTHYQKRSIQKTKLEKHIPDDSDEEEAFLRDEARGLSEVVDLGDICLYGLNSVYS